MSIWPEVVHFYNIIHTETYLKSFTDDKKCCVYNKKNGKQFFRKPKNILKIRYLYDFDFSKHVNLLGENISFNIENFPHEQTCEKIFSRVESFYTIIQENINSNYKWFTNQFNKFIVYQLIAIQMVRTPEMKKRLLEAYKTIKPDIDEDLENLFHLKEIIDTIKRNNRYN